MLAVAGEENLGLINLDLTRRVGPALQMRRGHVHDIVYAASPFAQGCYNSRLFESSKS